MLVLPTSATVEAGGRLAAGGTFEGLFYRPTVLCDLTPDMPAWREELFGPVAPVLPFATPDEAVAHREVLGEVIDGEQHHQALAR